MGIIPEFAATAPRSDAPNTPAAAATAEVVARLRAFVAADPAEFTAAGNRVRGQRIEAAVHAAADADAGRLHPDAAVTVATQMPHLTVADVIEAQRMVAEILAECDEQEAVA